MFKQILVLSVSLAVILPLCALSAKGGGENNNSITTVTGTVEKAEKTAAEMIRVKDGDDIISVDIVEYLCGVVAAEVGTSYEDEAIKAQAVAAHTVQKYRRKKGGEYDISSNPAVDQGYMSLQARRQAWNDEFDANEKRLRALCEAVKNELIYYDGRVIDAVYHDTSSGKTESSENAWGCALPYLLSVESAADLLSPGYLSRVTYTKAQFISFARALGINLSGDASAFVGKTVRTPSGTVKAIAIGGRGRTGEQVRQAFLLRSANFDLEYNNDSEKFVFTVRGSGHGVGMSQNGANEMAKAGYDHKQILKWYYTGCEING